MLPRFLRRGPQQAGDAPGDAHALYAEIVAGEEAGSVAKALSDLIGAPPRQGLVRDTERSA